MSGAKRVRLISRILLSIGIIGLIFSLYSVVWASPVEQEGGTPTSESVTVEIEPETASTLTSPDGVVTVSVSANAPSAAAVLLYESPLTLSRRLPVGSALPPPCLT